MSDHKRQVSEWIIGIGLGRVALGSAAEKVFRKEISEQTGKQLCPSEISWNKLWKESERGKTKVSGVRVGFRNTRW